MREKLMRERSYGNGAVTENMHAVSCDDLCYLVLCVEWILTVIRKRSPFVSTEAEGLGIKRRVVQWRHALGATVQRYYREWQR